MASHILRLIPIREAIEGEEVKKKRGKRFEELNKILRKFVTYYQDEGLNKAGRPYIWTE